MNKKLYESILSSIQNGLQNAMFEHYYDEANRQHIYQLKDIRKYDGDEPSLFNLFALQDKKEKDFIKYGFANIVANKIYHTFNKSPKIYYLNNPDDMKELLAAFQNIVRQVMQINFEIKGNEEDIYNQLLYIFNLTDVNSFTKDMRANLAKLCSKGNMFPDELIKKVDPIIRKAQQERAAMAKAEQERRRAEAEARKAEKDRKYEEINKAICDDNCGITFLYSTYDYETLYEYCFSTFTFDQYVYEICR